MQKLTTGNSHTPQGQLGVRILSAVAFVIFLMTCWFLYDDAELGLKFIWFFVIPLAPVIFLLIPNLWTAICPLATLQSIPKRLGINRDIYLNKRHTRYLNYIGIAIFSILVPARYFIFNIEGQISLFTMLALLLGAFILGFFFTGLSGWCMGICPIRPVELMFAQFSAETKRPEVCSTCDHCVSNCPRLYPDEPKKVSKYNSDFLWFIYAFPGFILGFYIIHPDELWYFIYLKMYGMAIASFFVFKGLDRILKQGDTLYIAIIFSVILYYVNIIPIVADEWFINERYQSLLYIIPFGAIFYAVLNKLPKERKVRFVMSIAPLSVLYFSVSAFFNEQQFELNNFNWQEHAYKVGNQACVSCHSEITSDFMKSQMGTSFALMDNRQTDLPITESRVYDSKNDLWYEIVKRGDDYWMTEERFNERDSLIHFLEFRIDYVIGSGNNTKSFVMNNNGYLFEMPLTWYTAKRKWDLSPGYEIHNFRFFRETNQACIDCHTEETTFETHSVNRFLKVNLGIDCEKCHGPGSLHIDQQAGRKNLGFRAIINPTKDQTKDDMVCYDCHPKKEVDFLEDYDDEAIDFTAHATRLSMSKCFTEGDLNCVSCHDPHKPLETNNAVYNTTCMSCHSSSALTAIPNHDPAKDCVSCHMPQKGSSDIPHVNPTEHWIKVWDKNSPKYSAGLNRTYVDYIVPHSRSTWEKKRATSYLQKYRESIGSNNLQTDTLMLAYRLMKEQWFLKPSEKKTYGIILFFTKRYDEALDVFRELEKTDIDYFEPDPEFYLFYGRTFFEKKQLDDARRYYLAGLTEYPNDLFILLEMSRLYLERKEYDNALSYVDKILKLNRFHRDAMYQRGYIYQVALKQPKAAVDAYSELLKLYPDDHDGLINAAISYIQLSDIPAALKLLRHGNDRYPRSVQILANLTRYTIESGDVENGRIYLNQLSTRFPGNPFEATLRRLLSYQQSQKARINPRRPR